MICYSLVKFGQFANKIVFDTVSVSPLTSLGKLYGWFEYAESILDTKVIRKLDDTKKVG